MAHDVDAALSAATERLCAKFPTVDPETVRRTVAQTSARFAGRPIQDFVPILVEREAAHQLRARTPLPREPADDRPTLAVTGSPPRSGWSLDATQGVGNRRVADAQQ